MCADLSVSQDAVTQKICVDTRRDSLLLPIYGVLVPFHISTVKNVSKVSTLSP
jgi:nucleosome binding factor SPN SPT16 subunit